VDLALGSVLVEEPVAAKRVRVLFSGDVQNLGRLGLESLELARADLHSGDDFQIVHDFLLSEATVWALLQAGPSAVKRSSVRGPGKSPA
jgi:hypothetical protein